MKVSRSTIPADSLLNQYLPADYFDVFECDIDSRYPFSPDDILINFWTDFPGWVNVLFAIRNFLVKIVGLKTDRNDPEEFKRCIREGKECGLTSVPAKNEKETVMLLSDKHLNAYLSAYIQKDASPHTQRISVTTLVHFNKKLGNIYFFFIKPFHQLIVMSMLKRNLKKMMKASHF